MPRFCSALNIHTSRRLQRQMKSETWGYFKVFSLLCTVGTWLILQGSFPCSQTPNVPSNIWHTNTLFTRWKTRYMIEENLRNQYCNCWYLLTCKNFVSNRSALVRFLINVTVHYILRPTAFKVFFFLATTQSKKYIATQYSNTHINTFHRARLNTCSYSVKF